MHAYILRPFGTKNGIDFDLVEATLIRPALARLGIDATGAERLPGSNLTMAIFEELATADLVIADTTGSHPNALFELGVRFALRDRHTVLIRNREEPPLFHLSVVRTIWYDARDPQAAVMDLAAAVEDRIRNKRKDSPVYLAIPGLQPPSLAELRSAPESFRNEVKRALLARDAGHLALLARETAQMPWCAEALQLIGEAQLSIRDQEGARETFETLRLSDPDNPKVNSLLATVYERLGRAADAHLALERVLGSATASQADRAEALALSGRNLKTEWTEFWRHGAPQDGSRRALRSPLLKESRDAYLRAYKEDLNHFYSGLNALALTQVQLQLAQKHPEDWEDRFEDADRAAVAHKREGEQATTLAAAVDLSLMRAAERAERNNVRDPWIAISRADWMFVTAKRAGAIVRQYEEALSGTTDAFTRDAVRRQLQLYAELGIFVETLPRVLESLGTQREEASQAKPQQNVTRVVLFTGHMIDLPGRRRPRFPAEFEADARAAIEKAMAAEELDKETALGIAGGSNGSDILFHEICRQSGIRSELYLPIPEEEYVRQSVAPASGNWSARFKQVRDVIPVHVLQASMELPEWLGRPENYMYWERASLWLLYTALSHRGAAVTLIALWNGEAGDGPGGAADMVRQARAAGAKCVVLNSKQLFGLE